MRVGAVRRAGWSVGDQVLSSATNFGLLIIVARSVSPAEFGVFALVMAGYTLVAYVGRGTTSDPLSTRYSSVCAAERAHAVRGSTGTALAFGLAVAAPVAIVAALLPSSVSGAVMAFAVVAPGVLLQDHLRFVFFVDGRPAQAFVNDAIWAVAQITTVSILLSSGEPSIAVLVLAWGVSGSAAAVVGLLQLGAVPRLSRTAWWLRGQRDLWGFYTAENVLLQATNILVLAVVGWVGGLAAAGSLRAATVVFGPLVVLALGVMAIGVPELAKLAARRPGAVWAAALGVGAGLAVLGAAWGLAASLLPDEIGRALLGDTWELAAPILPLATADAVASLFIIGPFIGLRALGSGKRSLGTRVVFAAVRLVAACVGAVLGGAAGALLGFAAVAPIQMLIWSLQVRAAAAQAERDRHDGGPGVIGSAGPARSGTAHERGDRP